MINRDEEKEIIY